MVDFIMANAPCNSQQQHTVIPIFTKPKLQNQENVRVVPAKYTHLADFYQRTISYKTWPKGIDVAVSDLVKSGFSYLGFKDRVQCFQCGGIIDKWQKDDDVDTEHARHLPHCSYIQSKLGIYVVEMIVKMDKLSVSQMGMQKQVVSTREMKHVLAYAAAANAQQTGPLFISRCSSSTFDEDPQAIWRPDPENLHPVAPRDIRARLDTEFSRQLISIGYKKPLLAQVIGERLAETGDDFSSFMDFFKAIQHAERVLGGENTLHTYYEKTLERMSNPGPPLDTATELSIKEPETTSSSNPPPLNHRIMIH